MSCDEFDKIEALKNHKIILNNSLEKTTVLLKTIDKTIAHLNGNLIMRDIEMYEGFDLKKQREYERKMKLTTVGTMCVIGKKIIGSNIIKSVMH